MTRKSILITSTIFISATILFIFILPNSIFSDTHATISTKSIDKSNKLDSALPDERTAKLHLSKNNEKAASDKSLDESYIVHCDMTTIESSSNTDQKFNDFTQHLQQSNSPDKQLAYILFASETAQESQLELLSAYNQKFPDNKRVLMDLVGFCSNTLQHEACSDELLNQASALDGDNGALWLQLANFYAAKGNEKATLTAMEKVISAPNFNDYGYENLSLFMQTSRGSLDIGFSERVITGLGYHAATPVWVSNIAKFCSDQENYSNRRSQLCLGLGKTMTTQSNSLIISAIGLNMQSLAYKKEHNDELQLQAEKEKSALLQHSSSTGLLIKARNLLLVDESLFQFWLTRVKAQGEALADEMLIKEAITLSMNPYYQPCAK